MAKTHPAYAPEFRRQMVELVRAGRDPADLAREFEPSAQAIRNWVAVAARQEGGREANPAPAETALNAAEREELARLRRENKQLRQERDILSRAAAWFARETGTILLPLPCRGARCLESQDRRLGHRQPSPYRVRP